MLPVLEFADETDDISTPILFKKKHSSVQCGLIPQSLRIRKTEVRDKNF
jgi:hypothetical protein